MYKSQYKLNPAGVKKTLLTPCRRVGLSRISKTPENLASDTKKLQPDSIPITKTKTPASTTKYSPQPDKLESLESQALKSEPATTRPYSKSTDEVINFSTSTKPKTIETTLGNGLIKPHVTPCRRVGLTRKSRTPDTPASNSKKLLPSSDFNTPINIVEANTDTKCSPQLDNLASSQDDAVKSEPVAKRNLNSRFSVESPLCSPLSKSTEVNNLSTLDDSSIEDAENSSCLKYKSDKNIKELVKSYKKQIRNNSDIQEDEIKQVFIKQLTNCTVSIPKISEEDINLYEEKFTVDLSETFAVRKKKRKASSNNDSDDDFQCTPQWERKLSRQTSSQTSSPITMKRRSKAKCPLKIFSSSSSFNEDENAFTSNAVRELHEKKQLLKKIADLESEIKTKSQKLETLRRASVYKSKHNIEELKGITEIWRKGCSFLLNDLLLELQNQAPIEMPKLLHNLRIPDNMVAKIFDDKSD